jgi:para-nitrobenzyl esterase
MRFATLAAALSLAMASTTAFAQSPSAATAPAAAGGPYSSTTTDIGTLLDDPAAKAVLVKHLPEMAKSDQIDMARSMTLKDVQQYAPDMITDKALADLDAELATLPPKK